MFGYITLGTNDLPRAGAYYDALMAEFGAKRLYENERGIGWGMSLSQPLLAVMKPWDGAPATAGNGTMIALAATSPEQVRRVHAKALELGGKDVGAPGPRGEAFYIGYFRDLDGNKLNACCMAAPKA